MNDFSGFGLPPALLQTLGRMEYVTPTPIQVQAIPSALQGKDVLGSAQTGTGKTGAFGIPIAAKLMGTPRGSALILTPTRELAMQVLEVMKKLLAGTGINTALLIGGDPMNPQMAQLRARPRLIVGTPGRINDHLARGTLMLHEAGILVLDETDRMLDMGFASQLEQIAKFLPKTRQTLMFSATLPPDILRMAEKYLNQPVRVSAGSANTAAPKIKHEVVHTGEDDKYPCLVAELKKREGSIILFVKTRRGAERLSGRLNKQGHSADTIHGDLQQRRRERVIEGFRNKKFRILVATDIAARGLDIPHIEHVINYDLPHAPEDYIHRIGRTARAGAEGEAMCLVSSEDHKKWRAIHRLMNPGEPEPESPRGGRPPQGNPQSKPQGSNNAKPGQRRRFRPNRHRGSERPKVAVAG